MPIIKSELIQKYFRGGSQKCSERVVVSDSYYETGCESFLVVKGVEFSKIKLNSISNDHITIKTLTDILIIPDVGKIDEDYDEIVLGKGSAVELIFSLGSWYIVSSDGVKMH
jgi:hypothetical protein